VHDSVETVEQIQLFRRVIAVVADSPAYDRPVLLFSIGTVILLACPVAGEGELLLQAVAVELVIDEL